MGNTGSGKGFDADTVDGKHAADFAGAAHSHNLPDLGGTLPIAKGGTGATDAPGARANLGLGKVDNTRDTDKPVSNPQLEAIGGRVSKTGDAMSGPLTLQSPIDDKLYLRDPSNPGHGFNVALESNGNLSIWNLAFGSFHLSLPVNGGPLIRSGWTVWDGQNFDPNSKANLNSPVFTGTPRVSGSGYFQIDDGGSNSVRYGWNADVSINGSSYYKIWHAGNFDPNAKANLTGAAFTGAVSSTGQISASGGFQPSSSRDLKTAFRPNPYGLAAVLKLETTLGKYHEWFNPDGRERVFLIAENIADVMPQVAAGEGIEATPPGESEPRKFKGYAIEQMLAVYAKAFQDLHAIVQAQGERIATLEQDA